MIPSKFNVTEMICEQLKNMFGLDFVKITGENWICREPDITVTERFHQQFLFKGEDALHKKNFWCPDVIWSYKGYQYRGRIPLDLSSRKFYHREGFYACWGDHIYENQDKMIESFSEMIKKSIQDIKHKKFKTYSYDITERSKNISKTIRIMNFNDNTIRTNIGIARFKDKNDMVDFKQI